MLNENKPKGGYANDGEEIEDLCDQLLKKIEGKRRDGTISKGYALGKTKAYFKSGCLESLEFQRAQIWDKWAVKIQKIVRTFLVKQMIMNQKYEKFASAVLPIQCLFRTAVAKRRVATQKKDKKRLKRMGKKSKKSAVRIQALVRGFIQRPKYSTVRLL